MSYYKAILSLVPNAVFDIEGDDYDKIKWYESNKEKLPSKSEADAEIVRLEKEFKDTQYQRDRAEAYPELKEQLDLLWHAIDGGKFNVKSKDTDFYKKLKAVKDANPKPE